MQARLVVDCRNKLGEGSVWNRHRGSLMWVDIEGRTLHEYDPSSDGERDITNQWSLPERSGTVGLTTWPETVVLALEGGLAYFNLKDGSMRRIQEGFEPELPSTRPNDGRVDRDGRLVFGGYNEAHRSDGGRAISGVYRLSQNNSVAKLLNEAVRVANSICFSPDGSIMYFCDSPTRRILAYPYGSSDACPLPRPTVFYEMQPHEPGFPDGATVDCEGGVWSAQFGAYRVVRHSPADGSVDTVVQVPVPNPTCVALGGPTLSTLFITTTRRKMTETELDEMPGAGGLYAAEVPIPGIEEPVFKMP